jgi:hypothetical protein
MPGRHINDHQMRLCMKSRLTESMPAAAAQAAMSFPTFELPASNKGYMLGYDSKLLRSFACPQPAIINGKADIRTAFTVTDSQTVNRMSPLWVILMGKTPEKNEWVLRYSTYGPVKVGPNIIDLATDLDGGRYILRIGYFLVANLSGDYPPYYSHD